MNKIDIDNVLFEIDYDSNTEGIEYYTKTFKFSKEFLKYSDALKVKPRLIIHYYWQVMYCLSVISPYDITPPEKNDKE